MKSILSRITLVALSPLLLALFVLSTIGVIAAGLFEFIYEPVYKQITKEDE